VSSGPPEYCKLVNLHAMQSTIQHIRYDVSTLSVLLRRSLNDLRATTGDVNFRAVGYERLGNLPRNEYCV
jgi:hypothetical protein